MKKSASAVLSLVLATTLVFGGLPAPVFAEAYEASEGVTAGNVASVAAGDVASATSTETTYAHRDTATDGTATILVQWNDPVLGEATTFHVSATGGTGSYKFYMAAPAYSNPGEGTYTCVPDPSCSAYASYTSECTEYDFTFTMTATGTYYYNFTVMYKASDSTTMYTTLRTTTYIEVSDSNYPSVASIVADTASQAKAASGNDEYKIALWLHDWLIDQMTYDGTYTWASTEAALTRHTGTCQAYTDAYIDLLKAAGLTCEETRSINDGHTWTALQIDGVWCQVDCTWDDSDTSYGDFSQRYLYFGLSDEVMALAHTGWKTSSGSTYGTHETSLANNYYVRNGKAAEWANAYKDRIQAQIDAKATTFSITSDNASNPPSVCYVQNAIVAYAINQQSWTTTGANVSLSAQSSVTVYDSYSWSATYDFSADYNSTYDVATYKPSADQSTWTAPSQEGLVFAGWYTDSTYNTVYTATSGTAYARFVAPTDLVKFRGCSLRNDYASADKVSLRFCYEFSAPAGATLSTMSWDYKNAKSGVQKAVDAKSSWLSGDGTSALSNIVLTGIERSGETTAYDATLTLTGKVSYTTADGTTVVAEGDAVSRTVKQVAQSIASGCAANANEKSYADSIVNG